MSSTMELSDKLLKILPPIVHKLYAEGRLTVQTNQSKLTLTQFRILAQISRGYDRVSIIAIAQGVAQPTMSKMVDGLVKKGFIARDIDKEDRRQLNLKLTKKGEKVYKEGRASVQGRVSQYLNKLDASERSRLMSALADVESLLNKSLLAKVEETCKVAKSA